MVACQYREDLQQAGVGDGCHFFRYILPDAVLGRSRVQVLALADALTGELVEDAYYTLRTERGFTFDERLSELEARNLLLEDRLTELIRKRDGGQGELFAVVGAFFERLSRDLAQGISPTPTQHLSEAMQVLARTHAPLAFPSIEAPAVSILIEAAYPLDQLHACLTAVRQATFGIGLRVTALDTGLFDETALLPSLARGVRYIRTTADLVTEWVEAERGGSSPILLFLTGQAVMGPSFLAEVVDWFEAHPDAGAVGGCVAGLDGMLRYGHLRVGENPTSNFPEGTSSEREEKAPLSNALSHHAAAFRRAAVEAVGGLDRVFGDDIGAATIDLCFRLREFGWSVACHPRATVALPGGSRVTERVWERSQAADLLRQRWSLDLNGMQP